MAHPAPDRATAGDYYRDLTSQHGNEPGSPKEWDAGLTAVQEPDLAGLERMHGEDADRLLMGRGLAVDEDSRARLLQSMHRAFVQFGEQQVRRGSGDWSPDAAADRFPAFEDATTSTGKPSAVAPDKATGPTLTVLFGAWEKDARTKGVVDKTIRDFRQKLGDLAAFLSHDRIDDITPSDIVTWTDHLRDDRGLTSKTIGQKYLAVVKRMFSFAKSRAMGLNDSSSAPCPCTPSS